MMKIGAALAVLAVLAAVVSCDRKGGMTEPARREALVSKGFIDDNTYGIVCRGYPADGTAGVQKTESAKRAALLGAYYVAQEVFTGAVAPDRDGATKKIEYLEDHVVLHYVIAKRGLRQMVRTESGPVVRKEAAKDEVSGGTSGTETSPKTE